MATMVQIAEWAHGAGLTSPTALIQATAVAWAESGGNPNAIGDTTNQTSEWGPSYGLWQIRSRKAEKGKGTIRDADRLPDPAFNARAMVEISGKGRTWNPWTVTHFRNIPGRARYQAALLLAPQAVAVMLARKKTGETADAVTDAAGGVFEPVTELASTISEAVQTPARIARWLTEPGTWVRISYFALGSVLLAGGVFLFVRPATNAVVGGAAQLVVPAGKAAKIVKKVVT